VRGFRLESGASSPITKVIMGIDSNSTRVAAGPLLVINHKLSQQSPETKQFPR
jgi:hypothetical protein